MSRPTPADPPHNTTAPPTCNSTSGQRRAGETAVDHRTSSTTPHPNTLPCLHRQSGCRTLLLPSMLQIPWRVCTPATVPLCSDILLASLPCLTLNTSSPRFPPPPSLTTMATPKLGLAFPLVRKEGARPPAKPATYLSPLHIHLFPNQTVCQLPRGYAVIFRTPRCQNGMYLIIFAQACLSAFPRHYLTVRSSWLSFTCTCTCLTLE